MIKMHMPKLAQFRGETLLTDSKPYLYRQAPIESQMLDDELIGGTVAWNQRYNPSIVASTTINGISLTKNEDGSISVSGTAEADVTYQLVGALSVVTNHKMLIKGCPSGGTFNTYSISTSGYSEYGVGLVVNNNSNTRYVWIRIGNGTVINTPIVFKPQIFDLTQMFNPTIADYVFSLETQTRGSGIAWLQSYGFFTEDFYPFDSGSLLSVKTSAHKTVGFNQWDEEWEVGAYNSAIQTVSKMTSDTTHIRSVNPIPVVADGTYFMHTAGYTVHLIVADDDGNVLYRTVSLKDGTFTVPTGGTKAYFNMAAAYGTTYNNDICINISGADNGKYEPYEEHVYPLSDIDLRGIPTLDANNSLYFDGDTYESSGTVTRKYKKVDISELAFTLQSINASNIANFQVDLTDYSSGSGYSHTNLGICNRFEPQTTTIANTTTEGWYINGNGKLFVRIQSSKASTASQFTTWLENNLTEIVYELATPTTETTDAFENPQLAGTTEEYVDSRTVPMPVGHVTEYFNMEQVEKISMHMGQTQAIKMHMPKGD